MRTLPTGSVDPNFGRRVRNRRQLNSLQNTWSYGYSMPIAVRYTQDAFSRSGWLWPVDFFFSSRRRHTRFDCDWSLDVCSSDLFEGRLATYGPSYLGFVQWALAMDPPPELAAAVVHVSPHDFSRSAYRNGAFDLYNYVMWSDLVAHQESTGMLRAMARLVTAERRLGQVLRGLPVAARYADVIGREPAWSERWMDHPQASDPFWAPMQCGPALERITVPVLLVGGWQDLFIEQTLEQYRTLAGRGVPVRLLVGPWAHLDLNSQGTIAINESLAWLDRYAGPGRHGPAAAPVPPDHPGRVWVGGGGPGQWREIGGRPPPRRAQRAPEPGATGPPRPREAGRGRPA